MKITRFAGYILFGCILASVASMYGYAINSPNYDPDDDIETPIYNEGDTVPLGGICLFDIDTRNPGYKDPDQVVQACAIKLKSQLDPEFKKIIGAHCRRKGDNTTNYITIVAGPGQAGGAIDPIQLPNFFQPPKGQPGVNPEGPEFQRYYRVNFEFKISCGEAVGSIQDVHPLPKANNRGIAGSAQGK